MKSKEIFELGYFVGGPDGFPEENLTALLQTIEDGVILPCAWQTTEEDADFSSRLDGIFGRREFASFVEIPAEGDSLPGLSGYGLGFTPEFLEGQSAGPITYLYVSREEIADRFQTVQRTLETAYLLDACGAFEEEREIAGPVLSEIQRHPDQHEFLRERMLAYANDSRIYCEIVPISGDEAEKRDKTPAEWRSTAPVHFTLSDVQTIYKVAVHDPIGLLRVIWHGCV